MKTLIFLLIILCNSICYGQISFTKDKILILVTGPSSCNLSRDAVKHFNDPNVIKYMQNKNIQFICINGNDMTSQWLKENKITHYPAIVYFLKKDDKYSLAKTVSGIKHSTILGESDKVRWLLGMNMETDQMVSQPKPPIQYVPPPQQYLPPQQQFINQPQQRLESIPSS